MTPPCKNCPDRSPDCHGKCERYAAFVTENEEAKRQRYLNSIHADGAKKIQTMMLKKRK